MVFISMVRFEVQIELLHWTPVNLRKMTYLFTVIYERRIASVLQDGGVNWIIFWNIIILWKSLTWQLFNKYFVDVELLFFLFIQYGKYYTSDFYFCFWYYLLSIYYLPTSVTDTRWRRIPAMTLPSGNYNSEQNQIH